MAKSAWGSGIPRAAVLLDVGGTLIECRPSPSEIYSRVLTRRGFPVSDDAVAPVFAAVWAELTQEHPRGLDRYNRLKGGERAWWGEFLRQVLAALSCPLPWRPVLDELFVAFAQPELWHVFPEVAGVLAEVRARGLKVAAVSNWDSRLPDLLERLGLRASLDALLVSALEGVEKPAPEIFMRAAGRLGVAPERCLHVGDSPLDDYRGAESAGMRALLLDRHGLFSDGYERIADLAGIHDYLD